MLIEVRAAGVSFPELLQTRGQYQLTPDLPFVPGSEVAGWAEYVRTDPGRMATVAAALEPLIAGGSVSPIVGGSYPLAAAGDALAALESRAALGKVVLTVG